MHELHRVIDAVGWAIVNSVWQSIAVAAVLAVMSAVLRNANAHVKYLLNCCALLVCFALPVSSVISDLTVAHSAVIVHKKVDVALGMQTVEVASSGLNDWIQLHLKELVSVWLVVVVFLALRFCLGLWWLHSTVNDRSNQTHAYWQEKVDYLSRSVGISCRVALCIVKDLPSPITMGCIRPTILVPAALIMKMDPRFLEALLAHEIAHIKRYDYFFNLVQNLIEIILFYHPAVWWISRQIRQERENIADDIAASMLKEPRCLALALQELESFQFSLTQPALGAHGGHLMSRIKRLVRPEKHPFSIKTVITCLLLTATSIGLVAQANNRNSNTLELPAAVKQEPAAVSNPSTAVESTQEQASAQTKTAPIATSQTVVQLQEKNITTQSDSGETVDAIKAETRDESPTSDKAGEQPQAVEKTYVFKAPRIDFSHPSCRPEYPLSARRIAPSGTTQVLAQVAANGRVEKVDIVASSGFVTLDQAVREALLSPSCVGVPGTIDGQAYAAQVKADFNWTGTVEAELAKSSKLLEAANLASTRAAVLSFDKPECRPEYPQASLKNVETGVTQMLVAVSADGQLSDVRVSKSSGFRGLDKAIVAKLSQGSCKAQASFVDGRAVPSVVEVGYTWKLN